MSEEKQPALQAIIEAAHRRWTDGDLKGKDYAEFVESLDDIPARVIAIKNLNYQVENGGFTQWHHNGYSIDVGCLIETMEMIKAHGSPAAGAVVGLLTEVNEVLEFYSDLEEEYAWAARYKETLNQFHDSFRDAVAERLSDELQRFDQQYYDQEQLLADIEAWVLTTPEGLAARMAM